MHISASVREEQNGGYEMGLPAPQELTPSILDQLFHTTK
jgi:hypothetical protein